MFPLRDENPSYSTPIVTIALIVLNAAAFLFQLAMGLDESTFRFGLIPTHLLGHAPNLANIASQRDLALVQLARLNFSPAWVTIFTSMFMHGSWMHIIGNMWFLWIFGNNIEDSMKKWKFVIFYLAAGVVANLAQVAVSPDSTAPGVGASGAIAAVLGAYALLYPRARVVTAVLLIFFFTLIELPALAVLGFWFLLQVLDAAFQPLGGGGVAYFAHIGGFLFGLLLIKLFADNPNTDYFQPRLPVY